MRFIEILQEMALSKERKLKGEVAMRRSQIADKHIQTAINKISTKTGISVDEITKVVEKDRSIEYLKECAKYSPTLFLTMAENVIEEIVFRYVEKNKEKLGESDIKFDISIFNRLLSYIKQENPGFFPLKNYTTYKRIYNVKPILVPNTNLPQFDNVKTAAATPAGQFIFNVPFMQSLLDYGNLIDLEVNKSKYVSQGGDIPDPYGYIEFLILHELLHYTYGDFTTIQQYTKYPFIAHNWATDLRSNYILVKSGLPMLPMGLISDDINFDRDETNRYTKLIRLVHDEMQKLPPNLREWTERQFDMDEHQPLPPKSPQKQPIKVGDIVQDKKSGEYYKVTKIDGRNVDTVPATPVEVAKAKNASII